MELIVRRFEELTVPALYEILKARAAVFTMEQNIRYLDMDDIDKVSFHMFFHDGDTVTAYLRAYADSDDPAAVRIGRVLTRRRSCGLGRDLMDAGLDWLQANTQFQTAVLDAQLPVTGFYEKLGFHICSDPFIEAGILHCRMQKTLSNKKGV